MSNFSRFVTQFSQRKQCGFGSKGGIDTDQTMLTDKDCCGVEH